VQVQQNSASVHDTVAKVVASSGAEVVPTASSWVDDGINFGSNNADTEKPAVALLWDEPTSSLARLDALRLERQYG
jgi:hypothetical protein